MRRRARWVAVGGSLVAAGLVALGSLAVAGVADGSGVVAVFERRPGR